MQRHSLVVLSIGLAGSSLLAGAPQSTPVMAQGLDFLFDRPPARPRRVVRADRPRADAQADVPLPVPRPHFPGDGAVPTPSVEAANGPRPDATRPTATATTAPPLPPEKPPDLTKPPEAAAPSAGGDRRPPPLPPPEKPAEHGAAAAIAPSGATTAFDPRQPTADAGCADRLKARGVTAEVTTLGPQPDARCIVVQPMRLASETLADGSTVDFPDRPTIACATADAFSSYVHDLLAPLAKGTWGTGVTSVWTGPGLECRSRDHIFGARLSAHGQGLAVDIAQLKLADGRLVAVGAPTTDAGTGFETAARAGACGYFHTVLGPGSDSYHRTHWHFDLEVRGRDGDGKFCK